MESGSRAALGGLTAVAAGGGRETSTRPKSFFDLTAKSLQGPAIDVATYEGKVVLVVNVATRCRFTRQYGGLQALYEDLGPQGLVVMGFPSNEFGQQEPGPAEKITEFLRKTYGVTFPMFAKSIVKPGRRQSPVYAFLTDAGDVPTWNFAKYLVGRDGQVKGFFPSRVVPEARALREAITTELDG